MRRLAPFLEPAKLEALLAEELTLVEGFESEYEKAEAIRQLAPFLTHDLYRRARRLAEATTFTSYRIIALSALAAASGGQELSVAEREQPLQLACSVKEHQNRAHALIYLSNSLPSEVEPILSAATTITSSLWRAYTITGVARNTFDEALLTRAFAAFLSAAEALTRPELLTALQTLLPAITKLGGAVVHEELQRAIRETATWYA